nr:uncharacterized protein LOC107447246 [Parasteatoda tepidariorum]
MVIIFYPILYWTGYSLTYQESIILAWSGLRSGFCLTLALLVAFDPEFPESENASKILVQVSGVIVLTLLVNANTVKLMMKLLRFKQLTFVDRLSMGNALISATDIRDKSIRGCKRDWKYGRADWNWLLQKTCMHDPYKGGLYGDESCMSSLFLPYGTCHECVDQTLPYEPNENELIQLKVASCCRVLRALKGNLLKQFRKGLIQRRTLKLLCTAIDSTSDTPYLYLRTKDIIKLVKIKSLVSSLAMKTSEWIELLELRNLPLRSIKQLQRSESHNRLRRISVWLYFKWWFEPLTNIIIFLNLLQLTAHFLCLYFYILKNICDKYQTQIRIFTFLFALFYVFETFIMILALNWGCFFKYKRNIFDLLISCIAVLDGFTDFFIMTYYPNKHSIYNHVRIVIILRLRICYVSRVLLQKCLSVIRHLASVHLYYSYDLGRGFLFANEHVLKNIETIVDFKPCAKEASEICIENIKELLEMLMDLEEKHPTIAVALKTNRAARGSLNRVKAVLDGLKGKSDISGHGIQELHKIHFEMTKSIAFAPRTRKIVKDVPSVLEAVDWIRNSQMLQIINENHIVLGFKEGDVIQDYQDNHSAIFVIARGIVKVTGRKSDMKNINIYNQLPNSDTYDMFKEKGKSQVCEYLTSSRTIGLLGYLQQTKSVTAAVCENDCEMIQIETSFLKNAERENKHLIYCMWRSVALNVAAVILKSQRRYINCADDILDARLHRGILPDMQEITNLDIPSVIDDMILVQGRAKDVSTSVIFNGPTYIQNSYRNLILLDDVIKRPPVIIVLFPDEKYDFSVCNHWTNVAEIGCSNICHKHNCNKSL